MSFVATRRKTLRRICTALTIIEKYWADRLALSSSGRVPDATANYRRRSTMKIVLYVLAAIGALALIAILGMYLMHGTMMFGMR